MSNDGNNASTLHFIMVTQRHKCDIEILTSKNITRIYPLVPSTPPPKKKKKHIKVTSDHCPCRHLSCVCMLYASQHRESLQYVNVEIRLVRGG
jgi:hypothetical protein